MIEWHIDKTFSKMTLEKASGLWSLSLKATEDAKVGYQGRPG